MRYVPKRHHKKQIKFLVERPCAGLFADPGLGKTGSSLAAFNVLKKLGYVKNALVIAKRRIAHNVWPVEKELWDEFQHLQMNVLHGSHKDDLIEEPHDISVVNPEGLEWLLGWRNPKGKWIPGRSQEVGLKWDMLIVDESTAFKNTTTERFATLKPFIPRFKRRVILTGDPAPNGLQDLFGQIYILDEGHALGQYITAFRNNHFDKIDEYSWRIRKGEEKKIYKKLAPLVLRMAAEDYIDLEPYLENYVTVELPEKARKAYEQMESVLVAKVGDGLVTAANVGVATMKCRQMANGGVFSDDKLSMLSLHDAKTAACEDIVEELHGSPCLIAYEFQHDLARLKKAFPLAPHIGGGVSDKVSAQIIRDWNAGKLPILLGQPDSMSHGLNLQGVGAAVIWYGLTWNLEFYRQFIRRVWRSGQLKRIMVHHIIAKDTVDEAILKSIKRKDKEQRALLEALREYSQIRSKIRLR